MVENRIQFVGHSCLWISLDNKDFIVDLNLSQKLFNLIKRHGSPGINIDQLPDLTALLVTHAHYDHLDIFSYKYFPQTVPVICPPKIGKLINRYIHNPVKELQENEKTTIDGIDIIALPVKHKSNRLINYNKALSYIIRGSGLSIYLAGDTGYSEHFKEIGNQYRIDIACLPIGSYKPSWLLKSQHMGPEEALQALDDLNAKTMIPIHWGSFRLAWDKVNESVEELQQIISKRNCHDRVKILQVGEFMNCGKIKELSPPDEKKDNVVSLKPKLHDQSA